MKTEFVAANGWAFSIKSNVVTITGDGVPNKRRELVFKTAKDAIKYFRNELWLWQIPETI